mgnify:CR=1 FL=1
MIKWSLRGYEMQVGDIEALQYGHVIGLKLYTCVLQEVSIRNAYVTVHSSGQTYRYDPLGGSHS